jgi:hypothetical protein
MHPFLVILAGVDRERSKRFRSVMLYINFRTRRFKDEDAKITKTLFYLFVVDMFRSPMRFLYKKWKHTLKCL